MDIIHISDVSGDTYYIDCTKFVSEIFGENMVKEARLILDTNAVGSPEKQIEEAKLIASKLEELYSKSGNIWFDDNELIIELVNGKTVSVKGSEWGSIGSLNK